MDDLNQPTRSFVNSSSAALGKTVMQNEHFDAQQWQRYIEFETGFVLPAVQLKWLKNAIDHTAQSHGLSVKQLWYQLPKSNALRQQLLDKVLIHESRFFRHQPSIDFVTQCAAAAEHQRLVLNADRISADGVSGVDKLFRIWSVGCAGGQEAWSLTMSLAAQQMTRFAILGTDVSEQALAKARLAQYDKRQQALIPQHCQPYVYPLSANHPTPTSSLADTAIPATALQASWQVAPTLQSHVSFALHNIIEKQPPTPHLQQVIICQNMLLYFRKFDQRDILARLSAQCAPGGYIVLAPGEALFWRPANMRRIANPQVNVWQKTNT